MSIIVYNDIILNLVWTHTDRQDRYSDDGQDYLWTDWVIDVVATINPAYVSYVLTPPATLSPGQFAPTTDNAIRHRLAEPHKKLLFFIEDPGGPTLVALPGGGGNVRGRVELECPYLSFTNPAPPNNYRVDARGGPYPQQCEIRSIHGTKSYIVRWQVKCCVNECRRQTQRDTQNVILSHRWRMREDVDVDNFSVRAIDGVAVFRADEMIRQSVVPDQFRGDLLHPVPQNYKRQRVTITQDSDGVTYYYQVIDQEMSHNLGSDSPATRVEAYQTDFRHIPSPVEGGFKIGVGVLKGIADFLDPGDMKGRGKVVRDAINLSPIIPHFYRHLFIRVWGDAISLRSDLGDLAIGLAAARTDGFGILNSKEESYTQDLNGKFVEYNLTYRLAPSVSGALQGMFGGDFIKIAVDMPESIQTGGRTAIDSANGVNPEPPNSQGTRGTSTYMVLAQLLGDACDTPAAPIVAANVDKTFRLGDSPS